MRIWIGPCGVLGYILLLPQVLPFAEHGGVLAEAGPQHGVCDDLLVLDAIGSVYLGAGAGLEAALCVDVGVRGWLCNCVWIPAVITGHASGIRSACSV